MTVKFKGVPYPILKSAKGYFHSQSGVRQIKSDLLILLLTNPGERVMLPAYGTPLRRLIFEPNDIGLQIQAKQMIINAIQAWEPRITVDQIDVSSGIDTSVLNTADDKSELQNILTIKIRFIDPNNIQTVQDLTLEVPLGGV